jgi:hypothetical protein
MLHKLCLFTHTRSLIVLLSTTFFTFIISFETQQCCAWTVLGTNSMSCLILLKLLDVCMWIFVYTLFLMINTCCVKGWKVAHQIFAHKEDKFTAFIMFISCVICFGLCCSVFCHCLLVLYLFDSRLLFGFPFLFFLCKHFFATIHLYRVHFPHCWVCIVFLFIVVFLFSTWSFPSLLFGFAILFLFYFMQQSTWGDLTEYTTQNTTNYNRNMF